MREVLGGSDTPGIDAEVIEMVMALFAQVGLSSVQLEINSIGHNTAAVDASSYAGGLMSRSCARRCSK